MVTTSSRSVGEHGDSGGGTASGRGVLEGAFALLDVLGELGEAGPTQLSEAGNLPKATVHRLLQQLAVLGAVEKRLGRYRIGPRILWLGQAWRPDPALLRAAQAPMLRLARATGASVAVGVLAHGQVVMVSGIPGEMAGRVPMEPGMAWPRTTAAGRALLAWTSSLAPRQAAAMPPAERARIHKAGIVFDDQGLLPDICCAAVPVVGSDTDSPLAVLCAMVNASYPLPRLGAALIQTSSVIAASRP
jgi:IclR family acetate operon transcriptional repressor